MPTTTTGSAYVLIADDDEDDRFLLARAFEHYGPGCLPVFTSDGLELLETLTRQEVLPDLIILDLNGPRLDGMETLVHLRNHPRYQHTPVVMLTTSSAETDRQRAISLGANDIITKPFTITQLGEIVGQLRKNWIFSQCC